MAWIDLLLIANYEPGIIYKRGIKVKIDIGQIGNGVETLANRWRWSKGKVLRWLNELETSGQIERQKNNVTSLITITNYKIYQSNEQQTGRQRRQQIKPQTGQQTVLIKEEKEYIYNIFYDSEIEKSQNNESYLKFVKILFGENNLGISLTSVLKMEQQVSYQQFQKLWYLREKYRFSITDVLERMENWKKLNGNKTVYKTFLTFIKRENPAIVIE